MPPAPYFAPRSLAEEVRAVAHEPKIQPVLRGCGNLREAEPRVVANELLTKLLQQVLLGGSTCTSGNVIIQ